MRLRLTRLVSVMAVALSLSAAASATELPLTGDAYVNSTRTSTNYGSSSNLYVGNGNSTYLQFSLASLPTGTTSAQVSKATLFVFANRVNTSASVSVNACTTSWSESSVTFATAPTCATSSATFTPSGAGAYYAIDLTALVQSWVTTPAGNYGISLTSAGGDILFDSKENDQTAHAAKLDVTLVNQGPQGIQGVQGTQGPQGPTGPAGPIGSVGSVGFTNGNTLGSASVNTSTGALTINFPVSGNSFSFYANPINAGGGASYLANSSSSSVTSLTAPALNLMTSACTLGGLAVTGFTYAAGTADSLTVSVYKNGSLTGTSGTGVAGSTTSLGCTLTVPPSAGQASCSSTGTASLAAGDNFYVQASESGNTNTAAYFKYAVSLICK